MHPFRLLYSIGESNPCDQTENLAYSPLYEWSMGPGISHPRHATGWRRGGRSSPPLNSCDATHSVQDEIRTRVLHRDRVAGTPDSPTRTYASFAVLGTSYGFLPRSASVPKPHREPGGLEPPPPLFEGAVCCQLHQWPHRCVLNGPSTYTKRPRNLSPRVEESNPDF